MILQVDSYCFCICAFFLRRLRGCCLFCSTCLRRSSFWTRCVYSIWLSHSAVCCRGGGGGEEEEEEEEEVIILFLTLYMLLRRLIFGNQKSVFFTASKNMNLAVYLF